MDRSDFKVLSTLDFPHISDFVVTQKHPRHNPHLRLRFYQGAHPTDDSDKLQASYRIPESPALPASLEQSSIFDGLLVAFRHY